VGFVLNAGPGGLPRGIGEGVAFLVRPQCRDASNPLADAARSTAESCVQDGPRGPPPGVDPPAQPLLAWLCTDHRPDHRGQPAHGASSGAQIRPVNPGSDHRGQPHSGVDQPYLDAAGRPADAGSAAFVS
jgi:hypothetical protein